MNDAACSILDQALALWAARGYDAVGVQQIVTAAGLTKPTLYYYFKSKEGLLAALLERHFSRLLGRLSQTRPAPSDRAGAVEADDLPQACLSFAQEWFRETLAAPEFFRLYLALTFVPPDSPQARLLRPWAERLYGLAASLFAPVEPTPASALTSGAAFLGLLNTYSGLFLARVTTLDDRLAAELVRRHLGGWIATSARG